MGWPVKPTLLKFWWGPELKQWTKEWYAAGCPVKRTKSYGSVTIDAETMRASMETVTSKVRQR